MSAFGLSMWGHKNAFVYDRHSKVSKLSILWHRNIGLCLADELNFNPKKNTLIPNRVRGAMFNLVGSFGNNIGGDPACVPLSLEGLSEATTCKPHRTCSMWMTCVNAVPMHGHAKEPAEIIGVQHRGACDFPRALLEWIGPHVVEMEALLHQIQAVGVIVDQLCWKMKSIMALHL